MAEGMSKGAKVSEVIPVTASATAPATGEAHQLDVHPKFCVEGAEAPADRGEPVAAESPRLTEVKGWWQAAAMMLGTKAPVGVLEISGSHLMKWRVEDDRRG